MLGSIYSSYMLVFKLYALYFISISLFSIFGKKHEQHTDKRLRFAILIPARNEENCISGIIHNLKNQDYPKDLIDIFVVANNCTDNTTEVAKSNGAFVIESPEHFKYKGGALRFAINELFKEKTYYDAFLVFDSDNEPCIDFVLSMNKTLCNGYRVAKSRILSKNREKSWVSMCYDIHFCTSNLFLNRARIRIGLSARLIGTGFAVTRDYLMEIGGFNTVTITEDAEFFAICAANGEKIGFSENAITYDEQSPDFMKSLIQRKRWMSGIMQVLVIKFKDLSKALLVKKSMKYSFDTLVQFSFAYIQALMPFILLVGILNSPITFIINTLPMMILKGYLYILLTALIVLFVENRLILSTNAIIGILMYPFFVLSFIPLQTISLFKRTIKWSGTEHNSSYPEQEIIQDSEMGSEGEI